LAGSLLTLRGGFSTSSAILAQGIFIYKSARDYLGSPEMGQLGDYSDSIGGTAIDFNESHKPFAILPGRIFNRVFL
jgi:hypothetical protein